MSETELPKFRGVVFGANRFGVAMVTPMPKIEDLGMYIHVEDIPKYLEFENSVNSPDSSAESTNRGETNG